MNHLYKILFQLAITFFFISNSYSADIKSIKAQRINSKIKVDGILDEKEWDSAPVAGDFHEFFPVNNAPALFPTETRIMYDDEAIYFGIKLFDPSPDSILTENSLRDRTNNCDNFWINIDTYHDKLYSFVFGITAAGVQLDMRFSANNTNNQSDYSFDAIWYSAVSIDKNGWIAEIKIPFFALRFPNKDIQEWGLNMKREIRRYREESTWSHVELNTQNPLPFAGILTLENIKPPLRLSFTPYASTLAKYYPNIAGKTSFAKTFGAGMDLKYGINQAITLDMALIPDFTQVQSDNKVLNIGAFEIRFDENRPFFKEGVELFNYGELFYPRRIGATPKLFYDQGESHPSDSNFQLINNPTVVPLINALKLSGRTTKGLAIGMLNAITDRTRAIYQNQEGKQKTIVTEPLTNYNIVTFQQNILNNSSIGIINTNVWNFDAGSWIQSNVTGGGLDITDRKNQYKVSGFGTFTTKTENSSPKNGYSYRIGFNKINGNFQFGILRLLKSNNYDPNALGIEFYPNQTVHRLLFSQLWQNPSWKRLSRLNISFNNEFLSRTSDGKFGKYEPNLNFEILTRKFNYHYIKLAYSTKILDFYEPRQEGRFSVNPAYLGIYYVLSTDYRRRFAFDINAGYFAWTNFKAPYTEFSFAPRIRFNNRFSLIFKSKFVRDEARGYVYGQGDQTIFSMRTIHVAENILTGQYIFNPYHSISLRTRHYWSSVQHTQYYDLQTDGNLLPNSLSTLDYDRNVNFFNIDLVYNWQFSPGSNLIFVYKNNISTFQSTPNYSYARNFINTLESPQENSISIKILYFLDYNTLAKQVKNKKK